MRLLRLFSKLQSDNYFLMSFRISFKSESAEVLGYPVNLTGISVFVIIPNVNNCTVAVNYSRQSVYYTGELVAHKVTSGEFT